MYAKKTAPTVLSRASARRDREMIDTQAMAQRIGPDFRLCQPQWLGPDAPLMAGRYEIIQIRPGLSLQRTDLLHLHAMTTRCTAVGAALKILIKLEGNADIRLGKLPLRLEVARKEKRPAQGALIILHQPEPFERRCEAHTVERMLVITLNAVWIEAMGKTLSDFGQHLTVRTWRLSPRAIAVAESLLHRGEQEGVWHAIERERALLELIAEALAQTSEPDRPAPATVSSSAYERVCRIRQWIERGEADGLTIPTMARMLGCNANTLQRHFRHAFGTTIADYRGVCRLQRAHAALQREGLTVTQAAELAGYQSQANFSTAFRRHFGYSPKQARLRM